MNRNLSLRFANNFIDQSLANRLKFTELRAFKDKRYATAETRDQCKKVPKIEIKQGSPTPYLSLISEQAKQDFAK